MHVSFSGSRSVPCVLRTKTINHTGDHTRAMMCRGLERMPCRIDTPCWLRASRRVSVHTQRVLVFFEASPGAKASSTLAGGCTWQARCSSS